MKKNPLILISILFIMLSACSTSTPPTPDPASVTSADSASEPDPVTQAASTEDVSEISESTASPPASVPSGLKVVYIREGNLWSWTEAGGSVLLTDTGDMSTARLSDDGQLLAFMRGREVWTVRMDGTDGRLLLTLKDPGGALWFAPTGSLLAVSMKDHVNLINLADATSTTVATYPATPDHYYPEVVWSPDASGFKTVIPAPTEAGQAELLFVFTDGTRASLAKFSMVSPLKSSPYISPDGGYVIYTAKLDEKSESLFLMDSSGATKPYGEPIEDVRTFGWQPDSEHFAYGESHAGDAYLGSITGPPTALSAALPPRVRWVDTNHYLAIDNGNLILGGLSGESIPIDKGVQDFDFYPRLSTN